MDAQQFLGSQTPIEKLKDWIQEAGQASLREPSAFVLSTVNQDNCPSSRVLLAKTFSSDGFIFFTNYDSDKGKELRGNSHVAANFHWDHLARQVRLSGQVEKISKEDSLKYWQSRPRESQISQYLSQQSRPVETRSVLESQFKKIENQFEGKEIPLPQTWGGYLLRPNRFEFWIAHPARLHDRFVFCLEQDQWQGFRLYP